MPTCQQGGCTETATHMTTGRGAKLVCTDHAWEEIAYGGDAAELA